MAAQTSHQLIPQPIFRKLRVFAVDPGLTARFETAVINEMTLCLPWEKLEPGPVGEYVAIIDEDENGNRLYDPIDLDLPDLLAQDGLSPSDGDPQYHQQMAYAVAMRTIRAFERALGRSTHWPQPTKSKDESQVGKAEYRRRLKLYPHYLQEANAYFDAENGVFRFGYFLSDVGSPLPHTHVFTCLSQDIIAHELTHGLMMGMGFETQADENNPDNIAFHEAFADLVAVFLHFEPSSVLSAEIARIQGRLGERSSLGAVALQFGQATGSTDGLRNALGHTDTNGVWQARVPDPKLYRTLQEPHARGDILVGAVFEAFKKIYESRTADLRRIASNGTGELPSGSLHPDLVNRLADEVALSAELMLNLCIRALDFMPPIGATFGDFLRALITTSYDADPADPRHYRVAIAEAFRSYGLCSDIGTISIDTQVWPQPEQEDVQVLCNFIQELNRSYTFWHLPRDREELWNLLESKKVELHQALTSQHETQRLGVIDLTKEFTIQSLQPRGQVGANGNLTSQWVIKLVQETPSVIPTAEEPAEERSPVRTGTTLVVDAESGLIRYQIDKQPASNNAVETKMRLPRKKTKRLPDQRRLRAFAFDPTMGVELATAGINEVTLNVPWERDAAGKDMLQPGPVGEYLEVVDRDPASGAYYAPVNLNHPNLLAQNGLGPSESNPQFHQQMVYAVAMRTIRTFEQALGRVALWSPRKALLENDKLIREEEYVPRLRIYPHALRETNAFYSPEKKALLFGYFPAASLETVKEAAALTVFTCLSHDIVAHETTHALLDGMHRRFNEPSNPDVLAFHEAFADIVALFLHFSLPEVLHHQVATTRGDLESQNRLGELAQQFGRAMGNRGALRSALGGIDPETNRWKRADPDPHALQNPKAKEPHYRGAILVAAVFDAFLTIYKASIADLLRIASGGTGILPEGHLHPDLVHRLADEAARAARYVLNMCIRALDYCPPVDITFGDYLRAVLTADFEFNPVDRGHRRVAFVEAFRKHGIVPDDVHTLSVDGLLWRPSEAAPDEDEKIIFQEVQQWAPEIAAWSVKKDRFALYEMMKRKRFALHEELQRRMKREDSITSGIDPTKKFEVHSIRPSFRTDWEGRPRFQWIIELTQRIPEVDPEFPRQDGEPDYYFRGGTTLVVDAETGVVRFSIKKPLNERRRERQRSYYMDDGNRTLAATYFGSAGREHNEPFAMLHRSIEMD
jgi:hypothetical protein